MEIVCDKWTTLEKTNLGPSVVRMGHSLFVRDNALYAVGGFNGKYFGGISQVPVDLPAGDLSCLRKLSFLFSRFFFFPLSISSSTLFLFFFSSTILLWTVSLLGLQLPVSVRLVRHDLFPFGRNNSAPPAQFANLPK